MEHINFEVFRGDDFNKIIAFEDNGNPKDITGCIVFFTLKKSKSDSDEDAVIRHNKTVHEDPTNGLTTFGFTAVECNALVGAYFYDIQYLDKSGQVKTCFDGIFTFCVDETRRVTALSGYSGYV